MKDKDKRPTLEEIEKVWKKQRDIVDGHLAPPCWECGAIPDSMNAIYHRAWCSHYRSRR